MLTNNHLTTTFVFDNVPAIIQTLKNYIGPIMKIDQCVCHFLFLVHNFQKYKFEFHRQNRLKSSMSGFDH